MARPDGDGIVDPPSFSLAQLVRPPRFALRLGLRLIKGLSEKNATTIAENRGQGYATPEALWRRASVDAGAIERLARADAFRSMGLDRRQALWAARRLGPAPLPLFAGVDPAEPPPSELAPEPEVVLPTMRLGEHVVQDYASAGLTLKRHPLAFLRPRMAARGVTPNARLVDLDQPQLVRVAGLVMVRQRPGSAKGTIFVTLEDETGIANLIVWPKVFERFRAVVLRAGLLLAEGPLQREGRVIHVVVHRAADLTGELSAVAREPGIKADLDRAVARADEVRRPTPRAWPSQDVVRREPEIRVRSRDFH